MNHHRNNSVFKQYIPLLLVPLIGLTSAIFFYFNAASVYHISLDQTFSPMSLEHLLGTDQLGRDNLMMLILGAGISIPFAFLTSLLCTCIGSFLALFSNYYGAHFNHIFQRLNDLLVAIPLIPLLIVLTMLDESKLGLTNSLINWPFFKLFKIMIIFSLVGWIQVYRAVYEATANIKSQTYVLSSISLGLSDFKIIIKHIIPQISNTIFIGFTLLFCQLMIFETTLSFLGLGISPPFYSWGSLLQNSLLYINQAPMQIIYPGFCICATLIYLQYILNGYYSKNHKRQRLI